MSLRPAARALGIVPFTVPAQLALQAFVLLPRRLASSSSSDQARVPASEMDAPTDSSYSSSGKSKPAAAGRDTSAMAEGGMTSGGDSGGQQPYSVSVGQADSVYAGWCGRVVSAGRQGG